MRTKLIDSTEEYSSGYGAGSGDTERHEYECPCGQGRIIEEHDNIPGFRDHSVFMRCSICEEKYTLDTSHGVRSWELVPK